MESMKYLLINNPNRGFSIPIESVLVGAKIRGFCECNDKDAKKLLKDRRVSEISEQQYNALLKKKARGGRVSFQLPIGIRPNPARNPNAVYAEETAPAPSEVKAADLLTVGEVVPEE